jgi:hypothetical protein
VDFKTWVDQSALSASSAAKYVGAIRGSLTKWANENKITTRPLEEIRDKFEFANVSNLLKNTDIFRARNIRGKQMYSSALKVYGRYLEQLNFQHFAEKLDDSFVDAALTSAESEAELETEFIPNSENDARLKTIREVVRRQGQPTFRKKLIEAYLGRCAVTGCSTLWTLQAAHVTPYLGVHTNLVSNGILLRADIHTLWDLHLLAVDPATMKLVLSTKIIDAEYTSLIGRTPFQPASPHARLSPNAIETQWALFRAESGI